MNLYKANKVSPLAGCLPMLLQMPIWFALYRTLMVAAELYQAPFIPGWIDDLTAPDPYYALPIALMGMMFVQAKLSPTTADSTQQKMMMYGLPLVFGVFGFFFPAGLTLYIFTNTCMTALHNVWMNRTEPVMAGASSSPARPAGGTRTSGRGAAKDIIDVDSTEEPASTEQSNSQESESGKPAQQRKRPASKGKGKNKPKKKTSR
jgi:YidC/Oxa1 family membrane protein insertase